MSWKKEVFNKMKRTLRKFAYPVVLLSFILTSCASTTMISTWKDETYSGNVKNILIIVVAEKPAVRRVFEQEYVVQLKSYGVDAVPSHKSILADKMMDKATILSKVEGLGIDSVLVTSLVSKKTKTTQFPGWYGYYSDPDGYRRSFRDEVVNLETALYDAKSEKLIWSTLSETTILEGESTFKEIRPFIETILKNLSKDELI
jgi:hypothetical protein